MGSSKTGSVAPTVAPAKPNMAQLALVSGADFAVWLGGGAIFPYLPVFLQEEAHASVRYLGVIAAAYFVGVFAFASPFGHLSDRVGRKPMMVFGTVLYAVSTLLFLTTTHPVWFIVFRFVEGMGAAAVVPAAQAFVAEITPDDYRSRAYGWLTSAQFGGLIIGPALAWPLYALGGGEGRRAFYSIFVFGAAITLVAAVALAVFLREPPHAARLRAERPPRPPRRALLTRPVLAIIVAVAAAEFAMGAWEVLWSIWLRHLGASMAYIGVTWMAFSVPMVFSFLGGRLADRYSRYALMMAGFAITAASWMVFSLTEDLTVYLVAMVVGGLAFAVGYPAKQAFLVQVSPLRWLGSIQGFEQTAMQLTALVATLLSPLLYEVISGWVFAVGGAIALAGLAVAAPVLRREWSCIVAEGGARSCAEAEARLAPPPPPTTSLTAPARATRDAVVSFACPKGTSLAWCTLRRSATGGAVVDAEPRRVIDIVVPQPVLEGAGVRLRRSIATATLDYLDPFLLFDHFESDNPDDYLAGFPMHPHRGIETVTYMLAGEVDHRDTLGNAGTIGAGDVQWMTSGGGIMHEEMPRPRDGRMGGFQLWVNMPAKLKMSQPRYQDVPAATIPLAERSDGTAIRVVAGEVDGVRGPVSEIYADPDYLEVSLPPETSFVHPIERGHTAFAYLFRGEGSFGLGSDLGYRGELDGELVEAPRLVVFGDGDEVRVQTDGQAARFLLVSGAPLGEPIARYGPFVMNTREEIEQALLDLRAGTFVWRPKE